MRLTPLDVQHAEFERSLRGFRPAQVRAFLERAAEEIETLRRECQALQERVDTQQRRIDELVAAEADLRHAVIAAERIAEQVRRNAEEEGRLIVEKASQARVSIEGELAALRMQRDGFKERFRAMLQAYERMLEPGDGETESQISPEALDASDLHDET